MNLIYTIQKFLEIKFKAKNLTKKSFAKESGIPYTTILTITHGTNLSPSLKTIIKIANYFNCSIDEVVGRTKYIQSMHGKTYNHVTLSIINSNLQKFFKKNTINMDLYKLSINLGLGSTALYKFSRDNSEKRTLNSYTIKALADHFKVSIDEMIGRI